MDIKTLKLKVTNCYLVRAGEKYLLVDTGYEYEWESFCKRLREVGVGLDEIGYVLLTHHHDDHSGLLNKVVEANSGVKVIMSRHAKDLMTTGKHFHTLEAGYINKRIGLLLSLKGRFDKKWTHTFPPYQMRKSDIFIDRKTSFGELGITLPGKIIETPVIARITYPLYSTTVIVFPETQRLTSCNGLVQNIVSFQWTTWINIT